MTIHSLIIIWKIRNSHEIKIPIKSDQNHRNAIK